MTISVPLPVSRTGSSGACTCSVVADITREFGRTRMLAHRRDELGGCRWAGVAWSEGQCTPLASAAPAILGTVVTLPLLGLVSLRLVWRRKGEYRSQSQIVILTPVVILLRFCYAFGPDLSRYRLLRRSAANHARGRIEKSIQGYRWYDAG